MFIMLLLSALLKERAVAYEVIGTTVLSKDGIDNVVIKIDESMPSISLFYFLFTPL